MRLDHLIWPKVGWGYMEPHESVFDVFRYIKDNINPQNWLEIGFHLGHSTTYTLEILPDVNVKSLGVTKCRNADRYEIGDNLKVIYGDRFDYFLGDPPNAIELFKDQINFDIALIDGDHKYESVVNDIKHCLELKIPYLLLDNCELKQVKYAAEEYLEVYNYKEFVYDSYWNGHELLEMRLYHVLPDGV